MKIKIKHLARIEGHAGFAGHLLKGEIKKAKIEIQEGARLIEGLLVGRYFSDAPIITARICGICPVIHNLVSIRALEDALGVKVKPEVVMLRKLMLTAQYIHSHTLHLFFLSLPDFLNYPDRLPQLKKYPQQTQDALDIRKFGNKIIETIGGRAIHPITTEAGGFKKYPSRSDLEKLYRQSEDILMKAINLAEFFKKLKYPAFHRSTNYVSLTQSSEYAIYDGQVKIRSKEPTVQPVHQFYQKLQESQKPGEVVKRVQYHQQIYMTGALARLNNNAEQLNLEAKNILGDLIKARPITNTFYNIFVQAIEVVHGVEETQKLLSQLLKSKHSIYKNAAVKVSAGWGLAASEAPRGTLYHHYELDRNGFIRKCNIITPTAQFLNNIEEDLKIWLPKVQKLSATEREKKVKTLIRAYDPCITCATH